MKIPELVAAFLRHCERDGRSPHTLRSYKTRLKPFSAAFSALTWQQLTRDKILDWLYQVNRWPNGREKSFSTQRYNIVAVQLLQNYAFEFHDLPPILKPRDLEKPPTPKRDAVPTIEQTKAILALAPPEWSRLYRSLRLTGARPSELVGAKIEDLNRRPALGEKPATLILKHHKTARKTAAPRKIPIGDNVAPLFIEAIGNRQRGHIFLDASAQPWTVPRVSKIFRTLRRKAGLPEEIVLYSARHEFGSAVTKQFGIFQAKELLGHTDIATTQRYSHLTEDELRHYQTGAIEDV